MLAKELEDSVERDAIETLLSIANVPNSDEASLSSDSFEQSHDSVVTPVVSDESDQSSGSEDSRERTPILHHSKLAQVSLKSELNVIWQRTTGSFEAAAAHPHRLQMAPSGYN